MRALIKYFIKYPIAGNVLLILILIFGYFGLQSLRKTFFPENESSLILIQVVYPGASPSEIEEGIILKIEDELDGLSGIDRLTSNSLENAGTVRVEVDPDYKTETVLQDLKNAVDRINSFPDGMEPPIIYIKEINSLAINFALSGDLRLEQLKEIARKVETDLQTVDGISKVELAGFPDKEIEIQVSDDGLKKYGVKISDISNAVKQNNLELTGGTIETEQEKILIRAKNRKYEALELENIIVKVYPNGKPIFLSQVATVKEIWVDEPSKQYFQGNPAIVVSVYHTIYEDIVDITEHVKVYIDNFNKDNSAVQASIINDRSKVLRERIDLLSNNGIIGFVMVLVLLSFFLHPRLAGWVALGIPVSFAGMFIASSFYGLSINVISLFGMIIVIGILVDDGIIISENIFQHWERGKNPIQAAVDATMEVLPAVFSAIMTTAIAFSLFFLLDGRLGEFFPEMGFVVIATLLFSLVEGVFILPAHIAHSKALSKEGLEKKSWVNKVTDAFANGMEYTKIKLYKPILLFAIKNPLVIVVISICFFVITFTGVKSGLIRTTVFPDIEGDFLSVNLEMPAGTNEKITENWINHVQNKILDIGKEIDAKSETDKSIFTGIQTSLGPAVNKATMRLVLLPGEERNLRSSEIVNLIQERVGEIPGAEKFTVRSDGPFGRAVSIVLYSDNFDELMNAKNTLIKKIKTFGTLKNIESSDQQGFKEVYLTLNQRAKEQGFTSLEIIGEVRRAFFGQEVQRLQKGTDQVKIWVRYDKENRNSLGDLENMHVVLRGKEYFLKNLVNFESKRGIVSIDHVDGKRSVTINADMLNPRKDSPNSAIAQIKSEVLPEIMSTNPNVNYSVEGQIREQEKTAKSASIAGPVVLILIIAIVVLTFRSFLQAATVFIMVPFGFIGVGWGHFFHDVQISMFSWFGVIALIGVMINDALVFIGAFNTNMKTGMSFKDSLIESGLSRYRPILLTSVTTIAGLGPLILETSFQAQFLVPMAIAIAYGLVVATFLTLIFLPAVLQLINMLRRFVYWVINGEKASAESVEPSVKELKYENLEIH